MRKKTAESTPLPLPRLLNVEQTAEILGVGTTKINEMIEEDDLPFFTLGKRGRDRRIKQADLDAWIDKQKKSTV